MATVEMTLEQPLPMKLDVDVYEYENGYNISCFDCSNGNAFVVVLGGAAPFTISWSDGPTGADRYNLSAKDYKISVNDANGCAGASTTIYLRGPERSDWSMGGNAGTTPGAQYIGTPDDKDVVFKSNGQERLRLTDSGDVKIKSLEATGNRLIYADENGVLKSAPGPAPTNTVVPWYLGGNLEVPVSANRLGPINEMPLILISNNLEALRITTDGKVGIGTTSPLSQLHVEGDLLVRGGTDGDIVTSHASATGPVLWARNNQAAWGLSIDPSGKGHILGDWNNPHPIMTFAYDKVGIGNVTMGPSGFYKLYVEGGIVSRDLKVTAQDFPDYVFAPDYSLMPLDELERFLNTEHHLPGFATATDVEAAGGFEVGDMTTRLLKLAEEQSLYILQLNKEMEELRARIAAFEKLR